jgi:hypothetical protein
MYKHSSFQYKMVDTTDLLYNLLNFLAIQILLLWDRFLRRTLRLLPNFFAQGNIFINARQKMTAKVTPFEKSTPWSPVIWRQLYSSSQIVKLIHNSKPLPVLLGVAEF